MREFMDIIEDVWRKHNAPDPVKIRMSDGMRLLTTIDGIDIHARMDSYKGRNRFHLVFVDETRAETINEFIFQDLSLIHI